MASNAPASFTPAVLSLNEVLAAPHALATLGLPLSTAVGDADVRAAYRAAALAFHPDKLSPAAQSDSLTVQSHGSAFIKVCEAFQAVKNADDRWKVRTQRTRADGWTAEDRISTIRPGSLTTGVRVIVRVGFDSLAADSTNAGG